MSYIGNKHKEGSNCAYNYNHYSKLQYTVGIILIVNYNVWLGNSMFDNQEGTKNNIELIKVINNNLGLGTHPTALSTMKMGNICSLQIFQILHWVVCWVAD